MNQKLLGYATQLIQRAHDVSETELSQKRAVEAGGGTTGVVNRYEENIFVKIVQVPIEERGLAGPSRAAKDHEAVGFCGCAGEVRHQQRILCRVKDL
jgi:hypothetical protein